MNAIITIFVFLFERKISNWLTLIRFFTLFLGSPEDVPSRVITNKCQKCSFQSLIFLCHGKDAYIYRMLRPRFKREFWKYEKYERVLKITGDNKE